MKPMIRLSKSVVGEREIEAVQGVLKKGFLGMGAEVMAFEQDLKSFFGGTAQVACVNTGTSALHLACQAIGLGPEDEVLIPSLTYVASFQAVSATGAKPVACDIDPKTGLLDLRDAAKRVSSRTRAIMAVHYASYMGDLEELYAFAQRHHLRVIEDAAHAFGCEYRGKKIGSFGDIVCFSFDGIKNITSGEGGAVVSSDPEVISRVQDARLLGVEKDTAKRFAGERSWEFDVSEQGWRYHMSDIMAAIGRTQLQRFESEFKPARVALASRYRQLLEGIPGIALFETSLGPVVPHIQPIRVLNGERDRVREALLAEGVQVGIHYKPNHLLSKFGNGSVSLPQVEQLYTEILTLPLHPEVTVDDVTRISSLIRETLEKKS